MHRPEVRPQVAADGFQIFHNGMRFLLHLLSACLLMGINCILVGIGIDSCILKFQWNSNKRIGIFQLFRELHWNCTFAMVDQKYIRRIYEGFLRFFVLYLSMPFLCRGSVQACRKWWRMAKASKSMAKKSKCRCSRPVCVFFFLSLRKRPSYHFDNMNLTI